MKGLLRKEFYCAGGFVTLAIFAGIYPVTLLFVRIFQTGFDSMCIMTALVVFALLPDIINRAEATAHWRTYAKTLPYSRAQIVAAKYLFSLLSALTAAAMNALYTLVLMLIQTGASENVFLASVPATAALSAAVILYSAAFLYPYYFRSIRRGTGIVSYIVTTFIGILYFIPFGIPVLFYTVSLRPSRLKEPAHAVMMIPYILLAVSAVIYLLSWPLSRRLYCRRKRRESA